MSSNSVASGFSSRVANRRYRIDAKFAKSPYLSNPIGKVKRSRSYNTTSLRGVEQKTAKSPRRNRGGDSSDAESVLTKGSVRSYRTSQTASYRRSSMPNTAGRMNNLKNLLLPRDVDKILRGFRQKHNNHPILTNRPNSGEEKGQEDDDSTIASDFAESIDDEKIYRHIIKDKEAKDAVPVFSGEIFSAITIRNADMQCADFILPPVFPLVATENGGDVSDLESLHSVAEPPNTRSRAKGRKKR